MSNGLIFSEGSDGKTLLSILRGASGSVSVTVPYDLTGYTISFQIATDEKAVPVMDLSLSSGITAGTYSSSSSDFTIVPTAAETAAISSDFAGMFTLSITSSGGQVTILAHGRVGVVTTI